MVAQSEITDEVSTRIYPDILPQNATIPAVTYEVISSRPEHDCADGDANYSHTRVELNVFAGTALEAQNTAQAIRKTAGLQGYHGTMGTVTVGYVFCEDGGTLSTENPTDGSQQFRYVLRQDYTISWQDN